MRASGWTSRCVAMGLLLLGGGPVLAQTVQWRPGIAPGELNSARIVRVPTGLKAQDLRALRDDQILETPSGRHLQVGRLRAIQQAFEAARIRTSAPRPQAFTILPAARTPGRPILPHETAAQLLARPPSEVVQMKNGHNVTVAQLRALAPYVQQRYRVNLAPVAGGRPPPVGQALKITSLDQLRGLPRNLSDSTILETPSGKRVTVGEVRAALKARKGPRPLRTVVRARQ